MEVEESKLVEMGQRVERSTEVERWERERDDTIVVVGAVDTTPGRSAGIEAGPVRVEVAVSVGLETKTCEEVGVIWRSERERRRDEEEEEEEEEER